MGTGIQRSQCMQCATALRMLLEQRWNLQDVVTSGVGGWGAGDEAHFKSLICPNSAKISNSDTGFSTFFDNINELTRCFQYKEKFIMA